MLTYQKRLTSANKAYVSNEIQRASIDIIEGRQPEEYKIQVLEQMYIQAYQLGDMDLAQSLRYQLDNQYVQQQNRQLLEMALMAEVVAVVATEEVVEVQGTHGKTISIK